MFQTVPGVQGKARGGRAAMHPLKGIIGIIEIPVIPLSESGGSQEKARGRTRMPRGA